MRFRQVSMRLKRQFFAWKNSARIEKFRLGRGKTRRFRILKDAISGFSGAISQRNILINYSTKEFNNFWGGGHAGAGQGRRRDRETEERDIGEEGRPVCRMGGEGGGEGEKGAPDGKGSTVDFRLRRNRLLSGTAALGIPGRKPVPLQAVHGVWPRKRLPERVPSPTLAANAP